MTSAIQDLVVNGQCRKCSKMISPYDKSHRRICMVYVQEVKYRVNDDTTTLLVHRNPTGLFHCYYCQYKTVNSDTMRSHGLNCPQTYRKAHPDDKSAIFSNPPIPEALATPPSDSKDSPISPPTRDDVRSPTPYRPISDRMLTGASTPRATLTDSSPSSSHKAISLSIPIEASATIHFGPIINQKRVREDCDPFTPNKRTNYSGFHKFTRTPSSLSSSSHNRSTNRPSATTSCDTDAIQQMRRELVILQMRCVPCDLYGRINTDDHASSPRCYAVESFRRWRREAGQGISGSCSMCAIGEITYIIDGEYETWKHDWGKGCPQKDGLALIAFSIEQDLSLKERFETMVGSRFSPQGIWVWCRQDLKNLLSLLKFYREETSQPRGVLTYAEERALV